jgi:spermidine synthase
MPLISRTNVIYQKTTRYNDIEVTQKGNIITLWSPPTIKQSELDLKKPLFPTLEYNRHLLLSLAFCPQPERILAFGLGAGVIPRILHTLYPDCLLNVVEIDAEMLTIAKDYFGLQPGPNLEVFVQDANVFLKEEPEPYDIIILDTYCGNDLPLSVDSKFFMERCASALSPRGILAANLMTNDKVMLKKRMDWIKKSFGNLLVLPGKKRANMIAFACKELPNPKTVKQNALIMESIFPYSLKPKSMIKRLQQEVST